MLPTVRPAAAVVCLSGGVDSSVAAAIAFRCIRTTRDVDALLRHRGNRGICVNKLVSAVHEGTPMHVLLGSVPTHAGCRDVSYRAVFMNNWRSNDHDDAGEGVGTHLLARARGGRYCEAATREYDSAATTVRLLNELHLRKRGPSPSSNSCDPAAGLLELSHLDFSECYHHRCLSPLMEAYAAGSSCNVDVLCNTHIKFGALLDHCKKNFGCDSLLVTGHYARRMVVGRCSEYQNERNEASSPLVAEDNLLVRPLSWSTGQDEKNDQTHFLADLCPQQLRHAVFPLGALFETKSAVRRVADELGLAHVSNKSTSTGLCFVNEHVSSARKQAAGAFAMWIHSVHTEEGNLSVVSRSGRRATRWVVVRGDDGLAQARDITHLVLGLHNDQRNILLHNHGGELPAYFATLGEKLHVMMRRGSSALLQRNPLEELAAVATKPQKSNGHWKVENFYVAGKVVGRKCPDQIVQPLRVIILSTTNADNALYQTHVEVSGLRMWVSESELFQLPGALYVAFRHHDTMIPCTIKLSSHGSAVVHLGDGHRVRCALRGQLAVFYTTTVCSTGSDHRQPSHTCVAGCGWIV